MRIRSYTNYLVLYRDQRFFIVGKSIEYIQEYSDCNLNANL